MSARRTTPEEKLREHFHPPARVRAGRRGRCRRARHRACAGIAGSDIHALAEPHRERSTAVAKRYPEVEMKKLYDAGYAAACRPRRTNSTAR